MQAEDTELEQFRRAVNCASLLEGWSPPWRLDRRESTRGALKYRREEGEVLIVNGPIESPINPADHVRRERTRLRASKHSASSRRFFSRARAS